MLIPALSGLENENELALCDQIRLAGLVDQLGDLAHRFVYGHALELAVEHQTEQKSERADDESTHEQRAPVDAAQKAHLGQVRDYEVRFSARLVLYGDRLRRARCRRGDRAVGAILSDSLRGSARGEDGKHRQNQKKGTTKTCKLPIHSEISKGEIRPARVESAFVLSVLVRIQLCAR